MEWVVSVPHGDPYREPEKFEEIPLTYDGTSFEEAKKIVYEMIKKDQLPSGWFVYPKEIVS